MSFRAIRVPYEVLVALHLRSARVLSTLLKPALRRVTKSVPAPTNASGDKPNLLLHIGLAKTGTTSIQQFCVEHDGLLAQRGIYYPRTGRHGPGHQMFGLAALPKAKRRRDVERPRDRKFTSLVRELSQEVQRCQFVAKTLISSERFGAIGSEACEVLSGHLREFRVHPIIYLRRQDSLAESMHAQALRVRSLKFRREGLLDPVRHNFRFHSLTGRWGRAFGHDNLIVRKFEKRDDGKDVVHDFLAAIGADNLPRRDAAYHLNSRLSRDALEYLFHHTRLVYGSTPYEIVVRKLIQYSRLHPTPLEYRNFYSPAERIALLETHQEENDLVARDFFGTDCLFQEPYPSKDEPWEPYPGLAASTRNEILDFLRAA